MYPSPHGECPTIGSDVLNGDERPKCPTCGQRVEPDPKQMWNGFLVKVAADAWNIGVFMLLVTAVIVTVAFTTGRTLSLAYVPSVLAAYLALVLVDVLAVIARLMRVGWPFARLRGM